MCFEALARGDKTLKNVMTGDEDKKPYKLSRLPA